MSNGMNWPIEEWWVCETCGEAHTLVWLLTHGSCSCYNCGTVYSMGALDKPRTVPKNIMKSPSAAKLIWERTGKDVLSASDEVWEKAYEEAKK